MLVFFTATQCTETYLAVSKDVSTELRIWKHTIQVLGSVRDGGDPADFLKVFQWENMWYAIWDGSPQAHFGETSVRDFCSTLVGRFYRISKW